MPQWGEDQDGGVMKERYRRVAATDRTTTTLLEDRWAALCTLPFAFANAMVGDDAAATGVINGERADLVAATPRWGVQTPGSKLRR